MGHIGFRNKSGEVADIVRAAYIFLWDRFIFYEARCSTNILVAL